MKNKHAFTTFPLILILHSFQSFGQHQGTTVKQSASLDSSAFDFWLGNWQATWSDSVKTYHATNNITRKMNGHFIHESFTIIDGPNKGYIGESYSTLDKQTGIWKQTWIDNQGAYLDFIGKQENGIKIFERSFTNKDGVPIRQRMLFRNIQADSFDWDWQVSRNGDEWRMVWQLKYKRV